MHAGRYHVHPGGRPLRLTLGLRPRQRHAADILAPSCRRPFMCFCLLFLIFLLLAPVLNASERSPLLVATYVFKCLRLFSDFLVACTGA